MPFIFCRSLPPTKKPTGHWSTTPQPPLLRLFCGPPPGTRAPGPTSWAVAALQPRRSRSRGADIFGSLARVDGDCCADLCRLSAVGFSCVRALEKLPKARHGPEAAAKIVFDFSQSLEQFSVLLSRFADEKAELASCKDTRKRSLIFQTRRVPEFLRLTITGLRIRSILAPSCC